MVTLKARDGRDPRELAAMDIDKHLGDRALKTKYVATMFDILAPGYDTFTRIFSFGMDRAWKRRLIDEAVRRIPVAPQILDLACGTGDLGLELAQRTKAAMTLGLDLSPVMLSEATRKNGADPMRLAACDMLRLCVRDRSFDVVSVGYGIRNTPDAQQALREIARVLKPGGLFLNLDFYKPANRLWRTILLKYMWYAGQFSGWLWHREPIVYGYISHSIRRFLTIPEFESALTAAGFAIEWRASRLGGGIGMHIARRL